MLRFLLLNLVAFRSCFAQLGYKQIQTVGTQNILPNKNNYNGAINFGKPLLPSKPKLQEPVPHVEVMDFYVPAYPYTGQDVELACGYKHEEDLTLQKIEWHRITDNSELMFFRYTNDRGSIYIHDWIEQSSISYHIQHVDVEKPQVGQRASKTGKDKVTVLKLKLHNAADKMSGKFECQLFMAMVKKKDPLLVPAKRDAILTVVDKNDPEVFEPNIRIENRTVGEGTVLDCLGEGKPAPHLSWSFVKDDDKLEAVDEDRIEIFPLEFDSETGTETSKVRLIGPFTGNYACTADSREAIQEIHFVETDKGNVNIMWTYKGTTTTQAPVEEEEPNYMFWYLIAGGSAGALLFLFILICCCCCCSRRKKKERRRRRAVEKLEAEKIRNKMNLQRGRSRYPAARSIYTRTGTHRSTSSRRSTKRRAPDPIRSGSTSTLLMTP